MQSILEIVRKTSEYLAAREVENPRLNAEWLVGHALGLKRMQLYLQFERLLTEEELVRIRPLVRRRAAREPLQYILGETPFAGLTLKCDRRALVPRPETEQLVELTRARLAEGGPPARILDLGTGTGALALALARAYPEAEVTAVDLSPDALALAAENATRNGLEGRVRWMSGSWYAALPEGTRYAVIVANPPYLSAAELAETAPEVRDHEPRGALEAGEDGLADLRHIITGASAWLEPGGLLALETGIAQHAALEQAVAAAGLESFASVRDLSDRHRYIFARAPERVRSPE
jgi:release factor glutamine methyltransferase